MKKCCIFGSAAINDYSKIKITSDCLVIAADGGYDHLEKLGLTPDITIGDFDSIKCKISDGCSVINVPVQKDDTDLMISVKKALELGFDKIYMYGVLGGRLDHTIANIQMLEYINSNGGEGILVGDNDIVMLQGIGEREYKRVENCYFSIFSISDKTVVTTTGTKYNLTDHTLTRDFSLGVSNEFAEEFARVEVSYGLLLIIYSQKR